MGRPCLRIKCDFRKSEVCAVKTLTRSQKKKLIETVKTILIVVLCVCCVQCMMRVVELYRGESAPNGVFWGNDAAKMQPNAEKENAENKYRRLAAPDIVMLKHSRGRYVFETSDEGYGELIKMIEMGIKDMHVQAVSDYTKNTDEDWKKALDGSGLYVKFGCAKNSAFEAQLLNVPESGLEANAAKYSEIIFVPDSMSDNVKAFVRTDDTKEVFSVMCRVQHKIFDEVAKKISEGAEKNSVFAYELNLDKEEGHSLILDSMIMLPVGEQKANLVVSEIPANYKEGIKFNQTSEFSVNLISAFGYNPNTIRRYADSEGKLILVSETGTISVRPSGQIEYKALSENDGVSMLVSGKSRSDAYSIVESVSTLTQNILAVSGAGNEKNRATLKITEYPDLSNLSEIRIKMDYFVDNLRVKFGNKEAVEAVIKNGILAEYRINVKTIERLEEERVCDDVLTAVDDFCEKNKDCKKITASSLVYEVNEDGKEASAVWEIKGE